ncbi:hypothetical protein Tco_1510778 [Tanacetum coccineum]
MYRAHEDILSLTYLSQTQSKFRELVISSLQKLTNMARFEQNPHDNHSPSLSLWLFSKVLPSYEVDVSGVHPYLFESAGALQFPHSDCAYTFEKIRTLPAIRTFHSDSFRSLLSILMFDDNRTSLCFLSSGSEIHASMLGFKGNNTGINLIIP